MILESCFAEMEMGVLMETKSNVTQQGTLVVIKANSIVGYISESTVQS